MSAPRNGASTTIAALQIKNASEISLRDQPNEAWSGLTNSPKLIPINVL
jgi:hypothetical protein